MRRAVDLIGARVVWIGAREWSGAPSRARNRDTRVRNGAAAKSGARSPGSKGDAGLDAAAAMIENRLKKGR